MKTDKNSRTQTRAGSDAHPEPAIPDTNQTRKYEITLHYTQYNYATAVIEAVSLAEAEAKAAGIEVKEWIKADGDLYVYSIEPISERQSHE